MVKRSRLSHASSQLDLNFSPRHRDRVFLGWDRPFLHLVVEYLWATTLGETIDLRSLILITPAARASARLLELLVLRAESEKRFLLPPRLITIGTLPDLLIPATSPLPLPTIRALLWAETLRNADATLLGTIVPHPPSSDDWIGWLGLGELIDQLDSELAGGFLTFEETHERIQTRSELPETERWKVLSQLREAFAARLDQLNLDDSHGRRRKAIDSGEVQLPSPWERVVLVGCSDLNELTRKLLEPIRTKVTALVHAPVELQNRFDRFGGVAPSSWDSGPEGQLDIRVVDSPTEQAAFVASMLEKWAKNIGIQDVVIGVPDPDVIPSIEETLEQLEIPTRNAAGTGMHRASPVLLLGAMADYLSSSTFSSLANLARHPDLVAHLDGYQDGTDWRAMLDRYQSDHIPHRLGEHFLARSESADILACRKNALDSLLGDLQGPQRSLCAWAEPIASVLVAVYGQQGLDPHAPRDRIVLEVCTQARTVLRAWRELSSDVLGVVSASTALEILKSVLEDASIPDPPERQAIELLGWLELAHDDCPALIVTGFNEGFVPKARNADAFLPDSLRRLLGLTDNQVRFARDAFLLSSMLASRERMVVVGGRRTSASDPLGPSRLSLCGDEKQVAKRILAFYSSEQEPIPVVGLRPGQQSALFPVPKPEPLAKPIDALSVTAFRDYLACPYRFYLKHIGKLRSEADDANELDARLFGILAHDVLREFGTSDVASSCDAKTIREYLSESLDVNVAMSFGPLAHPAVGIQVEQLRARLFAFASWQASWVASGKKIKGTEFDFGHRQAAIQVDGSPFYLHGRIDRIDQDETTGQFYIFDYKTANKASSPQKSHCNKEIWTNLQLPLYWYLFRLQHPDADVQLGYINLPANTADMGEQVADWTESQLTDAIDEAHRIVRNLRNEVFWPPSAKVPYFGREFSAICQDDSLAAAYDDEEEAT